MLKLLKVLFFSKTIALTPAPVDMGPGSSLEFELEKPTTVLTSGANLNIDVTSMVPEHVDSYSSAKTWGEENFEKCDISAILINTSNGDETKICHQGAVSDTSTGFLLFLRKEGGLETGKTYDKIIVETDVELRGVIIRWTNWSK